jgi:hypothetical protein
MQGSKVDQLEFAGEVGSVVYFVLELAEQAVTYGLTRPWLEER